MGLLTRTIYSTAPLSYSKLSIFEEIQLRHGLKGHTEIFQANLRIQMLSYEVSAHSSDTCILLPAVEDCVGPKCRTC